MESHRSYGRRDKPARSLYGRFDPKSFRYKSIRYKLKSFRSIFKVDSIHIESRFDSTTYRIKKVPISSFQQASKIQQLLPFQSRLKVEIPSRARREERLNRFRLKKASVIDSDAEFLMYLIQCIRFHS